MATLKDVKQDILTLRKKGYSYDKIAFSIGSLLGRTVTRQAIHKFLKDHAPELLGRRGMLNEG